MVAPIQLVNQSARVLFVRGNRRIVWKVLATRFCQTKSVSTCLINTMHRFRHTIYARLTNSTFLVQKNNIDDVQVLFIHITYVYGHMQRFYALQRLLAHRSSHTQFVGARTYGISVFQRKICIGKQQSNVEHIVSPMRSDL